MATVLSAFSLCVLFCALAVSSKPAQDFGSTKPSVNNHSVLKRVLKLDTVLSPKVENLSDSEPVLSLDSVVLPSMKHPNRGESLRRNKRQVITVNGCPGEMIRFMKRCMSFESYERLVNEEEAE
ncbi:hypothetical protein PYW07_004332 [Mythimna separata]|uniref:Melanin-concentrating hormone n=1 Tax=Mythimna separata TaxID=271217 RepID=A0AAD7YYX3_MYTSE|nr:hypothetical protein PYW07_004332 [Mythimna separata]